MTITCQTAKKAVSHEGKPHHFQGKSCKYQADRSLAAEDRRKPQLFLCRLSSWVLGIIFLGVVASVNGNRQGEMLCACLTSADANEKIFGLASVNVAVFLGRLAGHLTWYVMHNVCLNMLYEVFCVYLFSEIWHCLAGFYRIGLENQPSSKKKPARKLRPQQPPNTPALVIQYHHPSLCC